MLDSKKMCYDFSEYKINTKTAYIDKSANETKFVLRNIP